MYATYSEQAVLAVQLMRLDRKALCSGLACWQRTNHVTASGRVPTSTSAGPAPVAAVARA